LAAHFACEQPVRFVCGDNYFDPYCVGRVAKSRGVAAEEALRSILIARAFTAYQLVELVQALTPTPGQVVIITGVASAFFDDELSEIEAAKLFYRTLWHLVELSTQGLMLLLSQGSCLVPAHRSYFLRDLCLAATTVLKLERQGFTFERHSQKALPQLARAERFLESKR